MEPLYCFGRFELRPLERLLLGDGQVLAVGARAFDLLATLAASHGQVVSKDDLLERVWPGLVVEENNLQVQVSKLRRLLGPDAIATVPGRGYQLVLRPQGPAPVAPAAQGCAAGPAPAAAPNNLPPQRSSFIGREKELAACARLLRSGRLLTIVAIGGCGKTRLALELARAALQDFQDGVWFIDLAPLQEGERVPAAIGAALRVFEQPGMPLGETLACRIGDRPQLLVLDNCEQVIGAVADVLEVLLSRCPRLQVIATSRVAVCHPLERVHALAPLSVPAARDERDAASFDAVKLFVDRLQWSDPEFRLDAHNTEVVVDICRRLDGIPLALELAAARIRMLTVQEIAAKIDDRFRFLTGASRSLPRPQTLRATIQWSYDHLTPGLQRQLRALAVVAGSWSLATATALASDDGNELDMLDALSDLVNQSLVTVSHDGEGHESRYSLLETVRAFALDRLREAGEEAAARTRHLHRCVALAEEGNARLQGAQQRAWLRLLDTERENLVLAHAWCDSLPDGAELGLRLTAALQGYWRSRGLLDLGHRLAREALARAGGLSPTAVHARALFGAGDLAYFLGHHRVAKDLLTRSVAMARSIGSARNEALPQLMLAMACLGLGELDEARRQAEASLRLTRSIGDAQAVNTAVMAMAVIHLALGELDAAEPLFEESLALARERQAPINMAGSLINIAWVAIGQGRAMRARDALVEAVEVVTDIGHQAMGQMVIDAFAGLCAMRADWDDAARFFGAAQSSIEHTRQQRQPAVNSCLLPLVASARSALGARRFSELEVVGRRLSHAQALLAVEERLKGERVFDEDLPRRLASIDRLHGHDLAERWEVPAIVPRAAPVGEAASSAGRAPPARSTV